MRKKLTLKLDSIVIELAKECARTKHKSLSYLVEAYFRDLIQQGENSYKNMTLLEEDLTGLIIYDEIMNWEGKYSDSIGSPE